MTDIFQLLNVDEYIEGDEIVQIACGKYKLPKTRREKWLRFIRNIKIYFANVRMKKQVKKLIRDGRYKQEY